MILSSGILIRMRIGFNNSTLSGFLIVAVMILAGCQPHRTEISSVNLIKAGPESIDQLIGDKKAQFAVVSEKRLRERLGFGPLDRKSNSGPDLTSVNEDGHLILGYPVELIGQQIVFGGAIIAVSDREDDGMGGLKLTDLAPLHGNFRLSESKTSLDLFACVENCTEASPVTSVLSIPVVGLDPEQKFVYLDLTTLGSSLNIVQKLDPEGEFIELTHLSSKISTVDFSLNTLVFDVKSSFVKKESTDQVELTARWYIKLSSHFSPSFVSRSGTSEVGFFMTSRSLESRITRFPRSPQGQGAFAKYYIKNVPEKFKSAFADAFDIWNQQTREKLGGDLLEYEFVDLNDPRNELLVTGDIRYNILEWDLVNSAPYGGLGPSTANQFTGEIFSASVLVQGPKIEELYSGWFKVSDRVKSLRLAGDIEEAQRLMTDFQKRVIKLQDRGNPKRKTSVRLNSRLEMNVTSEDPRRHDPLALRMDYEDIPENFTYETYMHGYFIDMVAHELGHNLGLRHNFKGNLGAKDPQTPGGVSRSVMEYLGRAFRHLDLVGEYDVMAISYGYLGLRPEHSSWFCTDDDAAQASDPRLNPECSSQDGTSDPYGYFRNQVDKIIRLLTNPDSVKAPEWNVSDLQGPLQNYFGGMFNYAASAPFTALHWTNFYTEGRPKDVLKISQFVLGEVAERVCSEQFGRILNQKESAEARSLTQKNISDFQGAIRGLMEEYQAPFPLFNAQLFSCLPATPPSPPE